jgi:hypothetical protein
MCIFLYIKIMFYFIWLNIMFWKSCCVIIGFLISSKVHWTYDDWFYHLWNVLVFSCIYIYIFHVIHNLWSCSFNIWKHVDEFKCFCIISWIWTNLQWFKNIVVIKCPLKIFPFSFLCYIKFSNQMGVFHLNFGILKNFGKGN